MSDFFNNGNSLETSDMMLHSIFESIYGWSSNTDAFLGINLQWPKFDLPKTYSRYFLSWHTEQLDVPWLKTQAEAVYPKPIMVAYDTNIDPSVFPDNIKFVRWLTWHLQIAQLIQKFGACLNPLIPEYKISSLSFRVSQYKNYITAYLLEHAPHNELMLTYHNKLGKAEDLHGYPEGFPWLDSLNISELKPTWVNFNDNYSWNNNQPVDNGGWRNQAFENALVNCTNESFHYSQSMLNGNTFNFPGPYITEKTWKPLLAARPFVSVAQCHVYQELEKLGLQFNFGFSLDFDQDPGDLTRIKDIFISLDQIISTPLSVLYEQSLDSVLHNVKSLANGDFDHVCRSINEQSRCEIQDFLTKTILTPTH